jgi:hypothetical protein
VAVPDSSESYEGEHHAACGSLVDGQVDALWRCTFPTSLLQSRGRITAVTNYLLFAFYQVLPRSGAMRQT